MTYERFPCEEDCPVILSHVDMNEDIVNCMNCGADYLYVDLAYLPKCCKGHHVCEMCIDNHCFEPFKVGLSKAENPEAEIGKLEIVKRG